MKKKAYWIIAAVFVAIVGLSWFFALAFPPDPMVETYSAKMNDAYWMDPVHVQESITTKKGSEESHTYYRETWMSKDNFARIQTASNGQKNTQTRWDKDEYLSSTLKNGSVHGFYTITAIDYSYYKIPYLENVSYEETEDQLIFTYQNKSIPERYERSYPERTYSQASSVAVFTKDWDLLSLTVTERWEEKQDNGSAESIEEVSEAVYLPCTQESFMEDVEKVVWGYRPNFPPVEKQD